MKKLLFLLPLLLLAEVALAVSGDARKTVMSDTNGNVISTPLTFSNQVSMIPAATTDVQVVNYTTMTNYTVGAAAVTNVTVGLMTTTNMIVTVSNKVAYVVFTNASGYVTQTITNSMASTSWVAATYLLITGTNVLAGTNWVVSQGYAILGANNNFTNNYNNFTNNVIVGNTLNVSNMINCLGGGASIYAGDIVRAEKFWLYAPGVVVAGGSPATNDLGGYARLADINNYASNRQFRASSIVLRQLTNSAILTVLGTNGTLALGTNNVYADEFGQVPKLYVNGGWRLGNDSATYKQMCHTNINLSPYAVPGNGTMSTNFAWDDAWTNSFISGNSTVMTTNVVVRYGCTNNGLLNIEFMNVASPSATPSNQTLRILSITPQ